jgi:hypothetical protein
MGKGVEEVEERRETSAHYFLDRSTLLNLQLAMPLSRIYHGHGAIITVNKLTKIQTLALFLIVMDPSRRTYW